MTQFELNTEAAEYLGRLKAGLAQLGKNQDTVTVDDLAQADQLHLRGREAIADILDNTAITAQDHVADLGCGLGGPARLLAQQTGCRVSGYDLNPRLVGAAREMTAWTGLSDRVAIQEANVTAIPAGANTFDSAWTIHVSMFVADKMAFYREAARILKPGGAFVIYDPVRSGAGERHYPLPWAGSAAEDGSLTTAELEHHLEAAGFTLERHISRQELCLAWLEQAAAAARQSEGPPPLGPHLLSGQPFGPMIKSAYLNLKAGLLDLVEIHAVKR